MSTVLDGVRFVKCGGLTVKQHIQEQLPHWSEEDAEIALRAVQQKHRLDSTRYTTHGFVDDDDRREVEAPYTCIQISLNNGP